MARTLSLTKFCDVGAHSIPQRYGLTPHFYPVEYHKVEGEELAVYFLQVLKPDQFMYDTCFIRNRHRRVIKPIYVLL
jgi:hypothetical protein